jgi:hypothetical protein
VGAARERAAKLHHCEVREGAAELVLADLIEEIRLWCHGLVEETRKARYGLEHREVRAVHRGSTVT